jgi:hypothetical protein
MNSRWYWRNLVEQRLGRRRDVLRRQRIDRAVEVGLGIAEASSWVSAYR